MDQDRSRIRGYLRVTHHLSKLRTYEGPRRLTGDRPIKSGVIATRALAHCRW